MFALHGSEHMDFDKVCDALRYRYVRVTASVTTSLRLRCQQRYDIVTFALPTKTNQLFGLNRVRTYAPIFVVRSAIDCTRLQHPCVNDYDLYLSRTTRRNSDLKEFKIKTK